MPYQCVCGRYEKVGAIVTCRGSQMKTEQLEDSSEGHYPVTEIEHLLVFQDGKQRLEGLRENSGQGKCLRLVCGEERLEVWI